MDKDIKNRFNSIINSCYNKNKSAFAKAIGVSATVIENVVGKRNGNPSYEVLYAICANANISAEWLLTGEGEMLKGESGSAEAAASASESEIIAVLRSQLAEKDTQIASLLAILARK